MRRALIGIPILCAAVAVSAADVHVSIHEWELCGSIKFSEAAGLASPSNF